MSAGPGHADDLPRRLGAIFLLATLIVVAQSRSSAADDQVPPAQAAPASTAPLDPLFDCYRSNSAWGYTLSGRVVDVDGRIWRYGSRGKAWLPQVLQEGSARFYKEADLREKYTDAQQSGAIDAAKLTEKVKLIEASAVGPMTVQEGGARDAGYSGCHAYVRDAAHQRYRDFDLGSDAGVNDLPVKNESAAAQQLLAWLRSVNVAQ